MDEEVLSSYTLLLALLLAALTGTGILAGILGFLIFAEFKASNFIFVGYLIAAGSSIICFVWLCKLFVDFVHWMLKVKDLTKFRNEYLIGFGAIGISTVALRVLTYYPKLAFKPIAFTYPVRFITLPSAVAIPVYIIVVPAIYHFFVGQTLGYKCTWIKIDEKTFEKFLWTNLLIHVVLLIPCIRIAIGYDNEETRAGIIILQFFLTIPFAATLADFALVLLFGIRLIDVNEERKEVTKQSVESKKTIPEPEPQSKSVPSKPSCNICSAPYTETGCHTPRMLRECGHTICEQCANKLLNAKLQNLLVCPFCEKVTVVNGPAETLPKNFALLEQIKSVGKMPMMSVKPNVF